jgi:lipid II:glycine glycyltransferase (peptidoglycan interpeptide bridge formation enzyme)
MAGKFPVVNWEIVGDTLAPDAWDSLLGGFAHAQIFQTHGWGEFKRLAGWQPIRLLARAPGEPAAGIAQVLLRRLPGGFRFAWVPGGPCIASNGDRENIRALLNGFLESLRTRIGRHYLRCNFTFPANESTAHAVAGCLKRPAVSIGSGSSVMLELSGSGEDWLKSLASKHRYYVRKACAAGLDWRYGNGDAEIAAMAQLSARMAQDKAVAVGTFSQTELERLCGFLRDHCRILVGFENDQPVTGCTVFRVGSLAYYASAATVGRGRELSAAYAMMFELRKRLLNDSVERLDFGGIAPSNPSARGVDHFKRGFGGEVIEYLGEWELASTSLHRWLGNLAVSLRKRSL